MKQLLLVGVAMAGIALFAEDAYIEGTGTQAILTDAVCNPNGKQSCLEVDFQLTKIIANEPILGLSFASFESQLYVPNGKFQFNIGDTWTAYPTEVKADTTTRYTGIADYKNKKLVLKVGGTEVWSADIKNATTHTSTRGQGLFGTSVDRGGQWYDSIQSECANNEYTHMKLYSFKVYEDGVLAHYYKPYRSANGKHVGLKDLCTGKILLNYASGDEFLCGGDISDDPKWDVPNMSQPTPTFPGVVPETGDYVIDVDRGSWFLPKMTAKGGRVVKKGVGMLTLDEGNDFNGQTVVVSDGLLIADYEQSGLKATHLQIAGESNTHLALLGPKGSTFTAPLAASGAGTVEFTKYCGIRPHDSDLTVNFGPDTNLKVGATAGFSPTEFGLGLSVHHTLTLVNDITFNKNSITLKNPGKHPILGEPKPARILGYISNLDTSSDRATIKYWDGPITFVGNPNREYDMKTVAGWTHYNGTQVFTNYKFYVHRDWIVGGDNTTVGPAVELYKDCNYRNYDSWDYISGGVGTKMTVDGGTWDSSLRFCVGHVKEGGTGTLVLTNDVKFYCGCLRVKNGTVNQYGGLLDTTKRNDGAIFGVGVQSNDNLKDNFHDSFYNLYDGEIKIRKEQTFYIGDRAKGVFVQKGGTVTMNNALNIGNCANILGRCELLGGTFNQCPEANKNSHTVLGTAGAAEMRVALAGKCVSGANGSVQLGVNAGSSGKLTVATGGEVAVAGFEGGAGAGTLRLDGGTLKTTAATATSVPSFIAASVPTAEVTGQGGTIETTAGDVTLGKALVAATAADGLAHRWSFDGGSLLDSLGGTTATTVGEVTVKSESILLLGGARGASQVKLLAGGFIPTDDRGWTIEMWFEQKGYQRFARIFQIGRQTDSNKSIFVSANTGKQTGTANGTYLSLNGETGRTISHELANGTLYHLAFTLAKQSDGRWLGTVFIRNAQTGTLVDNYSKLCEASWEPSKIDQDGGLWLGNSAWADNDPNIEYYEIRTYNRALSEEEIVLNEQTGAGSLAFHKTGAHKLTLTGANTYPCATAVDAGTLALASGATIPATPVTVASGATLDLAGTSQSVRSLAGAGTVKGGALAVADEILPGGRDAVGTLTLDGTSVTGGTLVIDIASDGTCDQLVTTGTLDLSKLNLVIKGLDKTTPKVMRKIISGPVTGAFRKMSLPHGWLISPSGDGVDLCPSGFCLIIR